MSPPDDPALHKQRITQVFDRIAEGYDKPALRFFRLLADRLVEAAGLPTGASVLDAGTGTGLSAIAAARAVGPTGRVIGVDVAPAMLSRARVNIEDAGLGNIDLLEMSADALSFPDASFDAVIGAVVLFLMPDWGRALREWRRVVRPGGAVAFSVFGESAFQPYSDLYVARLQQYGVRFRADRRPFATQMITTPEQCRDLLREAGFTDIRVSSAQLGYALHGIDDWWEIVLNSGFRGSLARLDAGKLDQFRAEHLAEVESQRGPDGLWLDVAGHFAVGRV